MNHVLSNRPASGSKLQTALGIIGGLVVLMVVVIAAALWLGTRKFAIVTTDEPGTDQTEFRSRFGSFWVVHPETAAKGLGFPIYPRSVGYEHTLTTWFRGTPKGEEALAYLTVLRFRTAVPLTQVQQWYQEHLGSDFVEGQGWLPETKNRKEDWISQVLPQSDKGAVVFQHQGIGRERGAVLQTHHRDEAILVTLYEYRDAGLR